MKINQMVKQRNDHPDDRLGSHYDTHWCQAIQGSGCNWLGLSHRPMISLQRVAQITNQRAVVGGWGLLLGGKPGS